MAKGASCSWIRRSRLLSQSKRAAEPRCVVNQIESDVSEDSFACEGPGSSQKALLDEPGGGTVAVSIESRQTMGESACRTAFAGASQ